MPKLHKSVWPIAFFNRHGPKIQRLHYSAPLMASDGDLPVAVPRPSSSVVLISPRNEALLLKRVASSSSFPSAYVFPGGNLSEEQDGEIPSADDPRRHLDGEVYRLAAVRECFEESGILLARDLDGHGLWTLDPEVTEAGRRAVHDSHVNFVKWISDIGGRPDTKALIPFTRWITPKPAKKRFTTQMYLYLLPLPPEKDALPLNKSRGKESMIPVPSSDGGIEHTVAQFRTPQNWLSMCDSGQLSLFPPQYFLLHILAKFFSETYSYSALKTSRVALLKFLAGGEQPWQDKCICPRIERISSGKGHSMLFLDSPGPELEGSGRVGDEETVLLMRPGASLEPQGMEVVSKSAFLQRHGELGLDHEKGPKL